MSQSDAVKVGNRGLFAPRLKMRRFTLRVGLVLGITASNAQAGEITCLSYEPAKVTLTGTISRHMEYGAPNFGEDPAHDEKEVYWYLDLDTPICVNGKAEDSADMEGENDVRRLQIVYATYPRGRGWIGSHVSITGTLFHAGTGHHHTKVLIQATNTAKAPIR